jgi:predicted CXXCH cytochrome family protein
MINTPARFAALLLVTVWGICSATPLRAEPADATGDKVGTKPTDAAADKSAGALPADYSCSLCHRKGGDLWTPASPVVEEKDLAGDVHWQKGIRCHDCHGGSPTLDAFKNHRDDPSFRSTRSPELVPEFCGHCHSNIEYMRQYAPLARTDQTSEYWTSGHGRRLKASTEGKNPQVDKKVATCISCHGGHGILPVKNSASPVYPTNVAQTCSRCHSDPERMANRTFNGRPIGHNQFEQWKQSVHGQAMLVKKDLSAPTCNDCHGNHGALPPGIVSVANVCGTCHGKIAGLFANTRMKHTFEKVGLPGCVTCHGDHLIKTPDDKMLSMDKDGACAKCHNPAHPQYGATLAGEEVATTLSRQLAQLKEGIATAEQTIQQADRLGMEVRGPRFDLRKAFDSLTNARTLVHGFRPEPVEKSLDEGLKVTAEVQATADAALREYTNRRIWLAASLGPILLVVCLLLACIRSLPEATDKL